ncbi:MAG: PAS domain S-box protein [Bacteroidetes bacterium]|jgi:PAS domain S-box-containing protein|nr:PAS domain S-box protein [Bacteroidota bacterium]
MSKSTDTGNQESNSRKTKSLIQKELFASEIRYRRLFESAKDGILILDPETGKITDVNPFLIEMLGYSREEFIEKSIWEIGTFQYIYENKEKFLELQQEEYVRYDELPLVTSAGHVIHVEFVSNVYLVNDNKVIQCQIRDITARKKAEAVLEKTANELAEIKKSADELNRFTEDIIDTVAEPLLAIDKDLRVIKASRSFYKFFKVTAEETIGKPIYELGNHQWDIPKLKELLEEIIPEKNFFDDYEVEYHFSAIGKRVMLLNARQVKRAFGKEQVILLAIEDITERKVKEDTLKEKHRVTSDSLKSLLNHLQSPIIIWDTSMVIRQFNQQFELLSGYDSAEVIGKKIDLLFPKEKMAETLELLKNHLADEHEVVELTILTKDNHIKTVLWNSSHILDEEGNNIVATISQDITSRKLTEDALNFSETRYRRLFESAKDGILILDAETGKITDVNPFLIKMLGYSREEFIEKSIWEIGTFQDIYENKEKFLELQQKEYVRYDDLPLETADGREISVEFISNSYVENNKMVIQCNIRETTIRKQSELALQKSESQLRTLVKTIPDLVWLKDENGIYLSCNPMFERFFGVIEQDIIGKTDYDFVDRELADFFRENDRKAMKEGKPTSNEEWVTFADDGHRAFLDTIKSPIYDADGVLIGVMGIGRDITERKLAGQVLQASEERFRAIFDQAPIAFAMLDLQGHPILSNKRFSKMLGYSKDELAKMLFTEFTYPEDIDKDLNQFTDLKAGKISSYSLEKRYIHKNGNLIWANLFVTALNDSNGVPQEIIAMVEDITEQKKIHNEIKFQADLLNNVGQSVIATDLPGKVIYWNKAAEKIYGWSTAEAIGESIMDIIQPSEEQAIDNMNTLSAGKTWVGEFDVKRKDGSSFPAFGTNTPILDSNGKLNGFIGISSDITERKKAELELIEAKEGAEESDRLKTAFLANMSHEIRTPMNGILGFTELLKEHGLSGKEQQEYIKIIEIRGARMLNIINDIISISKIESNQIEITLSEVDINRQIEDIYNFFSLEAENKKLSISFKNGLPASEAIIQTDSTKVYAVLTNLVKNAIKFTQKGSIELGYLKKEGFLEFYVRDSGSGVRTEQKDMIFERFRQGSESLTRNYEGAGLGLSISKAYVEMLGGKIWVTNNNNNNGDASGATFYFTLPANHIKQSENISQHVQPVEASKNEFRKLKILIVEDDKNSELLISKLVEGFAGKVLKATTGIDAIEVCLRNPDIDLVLMDINMPRLNGYEATRKIREFNTEVVIIAQTAYALSGDREKSLAAGCNDYITKPIGRKNLEKIINKYFSASAREN